MYNVQWKHWLDSYTEHYPLPRFIPERSLLEAPSASSLKEMGKMWGARRNELVSTVEPVTETNSLQPPLRLGHPIFLKTETELAFETLLLL
jgi:hypothetical protein